MGQGFFLTPFGTVILFQNLYKFQPYFSISEISKVQPSSNESALFNLGQIGWRNAMIICDKYQN